MRGTKPPRLRTMLGDLQSLAFSNCFGSREFSEQHVCVPLQLVHLPPSIADIFRVLQQLLSLSCSQS